MIKKLTKHGNSAALVIEKSILSLLGATPESLFEVVTDGKSLILTPIPDDDRRKRFEKAVETTAGRCRKTFEELAK